MTSSTIISNSSTLFTYLFNVAARTERFTRTKTAGVFLALAGAVLVSELARKESVCEACAKFLPLCASVKKHSDASWATHAVHGATSCGMYLVSIVTKEGRHEKAPRTGSPGRGGAGRRGFPPSPVHSCPAVSRTSLPIHHRS